VKTEFPTTSSSALKQLSLVAFALVLLLPCYLALGQEKKTPTPAQQATAHRDGQVWASLIFASDEALKSSDREETQKTLDQLSKAFPGKKFQILGEHTQHIFSAYESWVVPSKDLFLKIDSKGPTANHDGVNLHLQLWREKSVLLKTDVILRQQPIFITGPKWGKGQLIMVIELR